MTLDKLIEILVEARKHFVPNSSEIVVRYDGVQGIDDRAGIVCNCDYDNNGVNIYIEYE